MVMFICPSIVMIYSYLSPLFATFVNANSGKKYNIVEYWKGICEGQPVKLIKDDYSYHLMRSKRYYSNFSDWCKEVVWWGNKKGAYLYPLKSKKAIEPGALVNELAGHY